MKLTISDIEEIVKLMKQHNETIAEIYPTANEDVFLDFGSTRVVFSYDDPDHFNVVIRDVDDPNTTAGYERMIKKLPKDHPSRIAYENCFYTENPARALNKVSTHELLKMKFENDGYMTEDELHEQD